MKLSACFSNGANNTEALTLAMAKAQSCASGSQAMESVALGNGTCTTLSTFDRYSRIPLKYSDAQGNHMFICGVPISRQPSLEKFFLGVMGLDHHSAAQQLQQLDGAFSAIYWDNTHKKLVIVTDILGLQPLYKRHDSHLFLLSTDLKAISAAHPEDIHLNPVGWGQFLAMGHFLSDSTSIEGVQRMPAASIVIYDPDSHQLSNKTYWNWPTGKSITEFNKVPTDDILRLLEQDIVSYSTYSSKSTIMLSGGNDSRLILALLKQCNIDVEALIANHQDEEDNADGRFARRIAKQFNVPYRTVTPGEEFFSSREYLDYLYKNEITTPSLYLFIAVISQYLESVDGAVWDGLMPGYTLIAPNQPPPGNFAAHISANVAGNDALIWDAARRVFSPNLLEMMKTGFYESLDKETNKYTDDPVGVSKFIILNRSRNRTSQNPLKVYAHRAIPFTPGINRDYLELTSSIDYSLKHDSIFYMKLFSRHFPRALKVPLCVGGKIYNEHMPVNIPKIKRLLGEFIQQRVSHRFGDRLSFRWQPSSLVSEVIRNIDPGHPDLNRHTVINLLEPDLNDPISVKAKQLLFYWAMWRRHVCHHDITQDG